MGGIARSPDEILDDLLEDGTMPSADEVSALCVAAAERDRAEELLGSVSDALAKHGWLIVDMTTDDDAVATIEIVPPEADG